VKRRVSDAEGRRNREKTVVTGRLAGLPPRGERGLRKQYLIGWPVAVHALGTTGVM
jgi:hypothetical protein